MARPIQKGLSYFPLDVDFFTDKKIKILKARYGADGMTIYLYLLCEVYKNGYYLKLDEDYEYIISSELGMSLQKIKQVLKFLLERSLFENKLFQSDTIITSYGIQQRYQLAIKERARKTPQVVEEKFWLLKKEETQSFIKVCHFLDNSEKNNSYSENNVNNSRKNDIKKSKEKKSKLNENKEDENKEELQCNSNVVVFDYYKNNVNPLPTQTEIEVINYWLKQGFEESLINKCIEIAVLSNKRNMKYIEGILKNLEKKNIKTLEAFENSEKIRQSEKEAKREVKVVKATQFNNFEQRDYDTDKLKNLQTKILQDFMNE